MNQSAAKTGWGFWVIGIVALVWNLLGVMNFIGQFDTELVASMPSSHRALIEQRPIWATMAFAIAVFGGAIGSVLLLLRKKICLPVFVLSLIGVLIQLVPSLQVMAAGTNFSSVEIFLAFMMPVIVATFLIWHAMRPRVRTHLT
ncbi:MAG: hypothetical protein AAF478_09435 [Pseudomonadota bacterium]